MMLQGYITLFAAFVVATAILYMPMFFMLRRKGQGYIRALSYLLFLWSLFLIVFATLILFQLPISFQPQRHILNLQPLQWLEEGNIRHRFFTEIRPNIMIFIPLGFFAPLAFKRLRKWYLTALLVFGVTLSVEFFQYFIGRSSDIDDLIANSLGGIIGYGIFKIFGRLFKTQYQR